MEVVPELFRLSTREVDPATIFYLGTISRAETRANSEQRSDKNCYTRAANTYIIRA